MANIQIDHQRTAAFTTCNGNDICQIELVGTKYNVKAKKLDTLKFKREGAEKTAGFSVDIDPPFGAQSHWDTTTPTLDIAIPSGQAAGDYKYTLSYPYDTTAEVGPLDPIIIIQPNSLLRPMFIVAVAVAFVAGFLLATYLT